MSDSIYLEADGRKVANFLSYTVEADIYVADHAFSLEIGRPEFDIEPGKECRLYVNDQMELTGIVDRRSRRYDKQGARMVIEGRDQMGLLVDSYCEKFDDVEKKKLSELTAMVLKTVPFINRARILFQQDLVGKLKTKKKHQVDYGLAGIFGADSAEPLAHIQPGMTVFQVLSTYAISRGQMFFSLPDGSFVFGRPMAGGPPDYELNVNREGIGVNVLSGEEEANIARRYSKVTVIGQKQGAVTDGLDLTKVNLDGSVPDPNFPFYKPYVTVSCNDSLTPKQHARLIMEKMRHDGYRLTYDLPRHSLGGRNITINRIIRVTDDIFNVNGIFLVSGRTLRLDKEGGARTTVRLSPPGLVEDVLIKGKGRR